uniref:Inositol-3-phosphate synthase 1 n=1 Tax=Hucho hucho TaxID=62062 RepID=A0A4W5R9P9_9TELE
FFFYAQYCYHTTAVCMDGDTLTVTPSVSELEFRTERRVPRLGVMLVGWGGNNGTTVTAAVLANRPGLTWRTKTGEQKANYYDGKEVNIPFRDLLPMVHSNDIVFDGKGVCACVCVHACLSMGLCVSVCNQRRNADPRSVLQGPLWRRRR